MKTESKVSKKIRKGDKVVAIAGNYRGMSGTVLSCDKDKVIVQGINVRKRHMKGSGDKKGEIIQRESPIHISNVKVCTADSKPVKLRVRQNDKGEKELVYTEGKKEVLHRLMRKSVK